MHLYRVTHTRRDSAPVGTRDTVVVAVDDTIRVDKIRIVVVVRVRRSSPVGKRDIVAAVAADATRWVDTPRVVAVVVVRVRRS